jgi:hypothetical protein
MHVFNLVKDGVSNEQQLKRIIHDDLRPRVRPANKYYGR